MTSEAKHIKIQILDEEYSLISDESSEDIIKAAHHVDLLMKGILEQTRLNDHKKIAILASLQIANELLKVKEKLQDTQEKESGLIEQIEQQLHSCSI